MVTRVVYNNKLFKIIGEYGFSYSNSEVTFNDITIDFTNRGIADIPFKYQEIKIIRAETEEDILNENGEVLFVGFLDEIELSKMQMRQESRELTLTLLSPLGLATVRTTTLVGIHALETAINRVLEPLINDGFSIKEMNVPSGNITTQFVLETVENCMNSIGKQRNIFWFINEKKEISINSIDYLFGLPRALKVSKNENLEGFLGIQPSIENIDYANVINIKNVRLLYSSSDTGNAYPIVETGKVINADDIIEFKNPIVVSEQRLNDYIQTLSSSTVVYSFKLVVELEDSSKQTYRIYKTSTSSGNCVTDEGITYSDDGEEEGEVVLQRDSFFSSLITGFKWNGEDGAKIVSLESDTALRYTSMRFMYSDEIQKLKGIISNSGQIEKTVDYNEKWTNLGDLIAYARSLIVQNSNQVNQVELEFDVNKNLKIGDIIEIDEEDFYIKGNFAVKEIEYTYYDELHQNWRITAKTTDFLTTYIDLFRPQEQEESEEVVNTVVLSEFVEERMNESHTFEEI